jgi:thiol-disulfide isomerase/thioredoxin
MTEKQSRGYVMKLILSATLCVLVGFAASCSSSGSLSSDKQEITAPDFTLPTMTGAEVTLSKLQGMPVLLNFWHKGCPPCLGELHYFDALAKQYPDKITIVAIDIRDSLPQIKQFFGDSEINFIVALDENSEVASSYAIRYTPTTFFIDSEGIIRYVKVGAFASEEELQASTDELLKY